MENSTDIESDYRKWLVFSNVIKSATAINEFEKALRRRKSTKKISITVEKNADRKLYFIQEENNDSILKLDETEIDELKRYLIEKYKETKSKGSGSDISTNNKSKQPGTRVESENTTHGYLYAENKVKHGMLYSLLTLLSLQILILPHLILNVDIGMIGLLRYPISLAGLFFCFKNYKRYYDYHLSFRDIYLIVWNFSAFLFFFYFSEITLLSIPDQIPNVTWTSFVFTGTLILGFVYLLVSSFILAFVFNLIKKII